MRSVISTFIVRDEHPSGIARFVAENITTYLKIGIRHLEITLDHRPDEGEGFDWEVVIKCDEETGND